MVNKRKRFLRGFFETLKILNFTSKTQPFLIQFFIRIQFYSISIFIQ